MNGSYCNLKGPERAQIACENTGRQADGLTRKRTDIPQTQRAQHGTQLAAQQKKTDDSKVIRFWRCVGDSNP